jgi:hypothetical protein
MRETGKAMPCDPEVIVERLDETAGTAARNVTLVTEDGMVVTGRRLEELREGIEVRVVAGRVSHFTTCPAAPAFGTRDGRALHHVELAALESVSWELTAAHAGDRRIRAKGRIARYTLPRACELQGLPTDFLARAPFTAQGKLSAVASGVPLPMGRAIARAVKKALQGPPR